MCLFKFDKEKYENTIRLEGEKKGEKRGKIETLIGLVKDKIISLQEAASRMGMTVEKFEKEARNLALYWLFPCLICENISLVIQIT